MACFDVFKHWKQSETGVFEFRDPVLERTTALTAADRKWMDEIVRDVNETWDDIDPRQSPGMQYVCIPNSFSPYSQSLKIQGQR